MYSCFKLYRFSNCKSKNESHNDKIEPKLAHSQYQTVFDKHMCALLKMLQPIYTISLFDDSIIRYQVIIYNDECIVFIKQNRNEKKKCKLTWITLRIVCQYGVGVLGVCKREWNNPQFANTSTRSGYNHTYLYIRCKSIGLFIIIYTVMKVSFLQFLKINRFRSTMTN